MSKILKDTFSGLFSIGSLIARHKLLKKETGARFSTQDELKSLFFARNSGVLIDGNNKRLSEKDSFEHIAVIAKPGSGKTTAYIIPNILELAKSNNSFLVNDPSGEVIGLTSGYLEECGYRILKLSPDELETSSRFNPFAGLDARHTIEIEQICASIIMSKYSSDKEQVWNDGAISIMEILAKCLAYSQPTKLNLVELNSLVQRFGADGTGLDDWVAENAINPFYSDDRTLFESWLGLTSSNKKMLSTYVTICKTALKQLNNHQVQELLRSDSLDLENFRKEKTIIYLNFPESQQAYYQFIIDVFYARLFTVLMDHKPTKHELNVYCFLDEFGNSYIHNFSVIINNVRKYRVSLSLVFQGISQLEDKYGKSKAKAIKAGLGSSLIFKGGDLDTNSEYSAIIGERVVTYREKFTDIVDKYSKQTLMSADQLRTMEDNQAMFISRNKYPTIIETVAYYNNRRFSRLTRKAPALCSGQSIKLDFDTKLRI
ncbi:MAG: type IV secretory system conjugative DNA transfer family protein [Colwellia sp.]